ASEPQRRERRRRGGQTKARDVTRERLGERRLEPLETAEQRQARTHLEQEAFRRLEAHGRRETSGGRGRGLAQAPFGLRGTLEHAQRPRERERRGKIEARPDAARTRGVVRSDDAQASAVRLDDDGRPRITAGGRIDRVERELRVIRRNPQKLPSRRRIGRSL